MHRNKILIVEDEILVADNIKKTIEKNGYDVASLAVSGEKALQIAEEEKPDLVLMDIVIKGEMDGIITAERISKQFGIPVIFLTAYSDEDTFKRAKITEPFGYITKPFERRQLCMAIEMALYKSKMEKERQKLQDEIKVLQGFLPICAQCKKIRDDKGEWEEVADYIRDHSEAEFTHSICPECVKELYPELDEDE